MNKQSRSVTVSFRLTPGQKDKLIKEAHSQKKELNSFLYELVKKYMNRGDLQESEKPRLKEFSQNISDQILTKVISKIDSYQKQRSDDYENVRKAVEKIGDYLQLINKKVSK